MHDPRVVAFEIRRPWPERIPTKTGHRWYWPAIITFWHREPGGRDSGTICKRNSHWRWHIHHLRIQIRPLQHLRRWALTRCAWCGGPSRKSDRINIGSSWNGIRSHWWQGERGLFHHDCNTVWHASRKCLCRFPDLPRGHGRCVGCGKFRSFGTGVSEADRLLATLPSGSRIPSEMRPLLEQIWAERLRARGVDPESTVKP
jgi:hypothetical protein